MQIPGGKPAPECGSDAPERAGPHAAVRFGRLGGNRYLYAVNPKTLPNMSMRRFLFLLGASLVTLFAAAQPVGDRYAKCEYDIPMRDGVRLHTSVYSPKGDGKAPILIFRTPYGTGPYGADAFPDSFSKGYMRCYIDRGYIIVQQDVRGRYRSEGEFVHVRPVGEGPVDETTDCYDTVEFLLRHVPGHNGRVGFAGCSYPGFYALMGGLCGHPAVKAVSPQAPVTDWYMGDDVHHNGVLMLSDAVRFLNSMNTPPGHRPTEKMLRRPLSTTPDEYTFFRNHQTRSDLTELLAPNAFWEEIAAHPDYDDWWQRRDTRRLCRDMGPAVLVVGGTFDAEDCFGAWNLYRTIAEQSPATPLYLVAGPWAHGAWRTDGRRLGDCDFGEEASGNYYMEHFELPFFEYYLRAGEGPEPLPPVSVFSSGDNRWHSFGEWIPRSAGALTLYLHDGGGLSCERPGKTDSSTSYLSDPSDPVPYLAAFATHRPKEYMVADQRFLDGRGDVATFVSEPLSEPQTFAGPLEIDLSVALSTTDADFVVKLIDLFPDGDDKDPGRQMLVRGEVMRGRYRNGFSDPRPFEPGRPERVRFRTTDLVHTFRTGHRIMIQVQSTWFPLVELHPQQFVDLWRCTPDDFIPCRVTLFHERDRASSVTLHRL